MCASQFLYHYLPVLHQSSSRYQFLQKIFSSGCQHFNGVCLVKIIILVYYPLIQASSCLLTLLRATSSASPSSLDTFFVYSLFLAGFSPRSTSPCFLHLCSLHEKQPPPPPSLPNNTVCCRSVKIRRYGGHGESACSSFRRK